MDSSAGDVDVLARFRRIEFRIFASKSAGLTILIRFVIIVTYRDLLKFGVIFHKGGKIMLTRRPKGRRGSQMCVKEQEDGRIGCGHKVGRGKGNAHAICPPLRGKHGDRKCSLMAKKTTSGVGTEIISKRGVSGSGAKSRGASAPKST